MSSSVAPAVITADWGHGKPEPYNVQYNPKEFSLEKSIQHGEINIPGLDAPLQQFVRGQAEKLSVELFFDNVLGCNAGMVGARHPEHLAAAHTLPATENILQSIVQGMTHV